MQELRLAHGSVLITAPRSPLVKFEIISLQFLFKLGRNPFLKLRVPSNFGQRVTRCFVSIPDKVDFIRWENVIRCDKAEHDFA